MNTPIPITRLLPLDVRAAWHLLTARFLGGQDFGRRYLHLPTRTLNVDRLRRDMAALSTGEGLLCSAALALWGAEHAFDLGDIVRLDDASFERLVEAMRIRRGEPATADALR